MGGKAPNIGFHSVIDNPDPVNRVIPPNTTWIIIMPTPTNNHMATGLEERCKLEEYIRLTKVGRAGEKNVNG